MSNKAKISIIIAFVAFSTWFYFTPHLAVSGMRSAAEANDAEKLSDYVNFPALKENLRAMRRMAACKTHPADSFA